ncbi:histidine kinase dimerization/phospho-acceptor domain-containing protein [Reichenbachiella sp.]|uniref:histidine kinase dimerization/phospho-acceptor domain-containing protein n=1 Tax=Reichenbachiella sp. TaxID=2184521 RepID=UPI003B5B72BD
MISDIRQRVAASPILADLVNAIFFGILSILFGYVKIKMPDFDGVSADFREIPLLIAIFYFRSLWPVFLICGITILTPSSVNWVTVYGMHFIALAFVWVTYHKLIDHIKTDWKRAIGWFVVSTFYYFFFIIPLLITFSHWLSPKEGLDFVAYYFNMLHLIKYEYIVTALVTTMYLVQLDIRRKLIAHELSLEEQVKDRTQKLALANDKLHKMNLNLDELAIQRSERIKEQLNTINTYALMNSHQLRAPLSNILGLVGLLKKDKEEEERLQLIDNLDQSAVQLDEIIKEMNELLEKEMKLPSDRADEQH